MYLEQIPIDGIPAAKLAGKLRFGFIGHTPNTDLFQGRLKLKNGYIPTNEDMRTNLPGVFAAGNVRVKSLRQVAAAADGAIAAVQAEKYLMA